MRARPRLVLSALRFLPFAALLGSCGEPGERDALDAAEPVELSQPWFVDVAAAAGLDFVHENGSTGRFYYPEIAHAGAAFVDFDNDDWLDIYLVQSGPLPTRPETGRNANLLYRNRGDGSFEEITAVAGVGDRGYGTGVAVADYDRDGWVDLYVTNLGANTLYHNNGDGTFTDRSDDASVGDPGYSTSAAFVDFDRDGDLDLYVCNYLDWSLDTDRHCLGFNGLRGYCRPSEYPPQADTLYRNEGDGTFTDRSDAAGISSRPGNGLGVVTADFDGDGWVDVYVANDQQPNHLWMNSGDGTFREEALIRGAALNELGDPEAGMGVVTEDWDDDGDWDLFMVHLTGETNTFYRNLGGEFRDLTDQLGLGGVSQPYTGFGTALFDYDNDGRFDIFIANGKVSTGDEVDFDYAEPNQLLRGGGDLAFLDVSAQAGEVFGRLEVSRSAAFGDYDNDGDVDVLLANNGGPARLLRNGVGSRRHWLSVQLVGRKGERDRDAIGSVVALEAGGRVRRRQVQPAYGYCASNDPRVHFGLGDLERVDRLVVGWPDGTRRELLEVAANQFLKLTPD